MEYSYKFISLVSKVCSSNDHNLQFIGQGNPHAQILLVGKDCNVDLSTTRGKGCYEMEYLHSAAKWKRNVDSGTEPSEVIDWGIQEQLKRISYSLVMLMIAFWVELPENKRFKLYLVVSSDEP